MARGEGGAIASRAAFWDTSALVPLCIQQDTTARATTMYRRYEIVIWWATPVEIQSAVARLVRTGQISTDGLRRARKVAEFLSNAWSAVQPSDGLRARALDIVDRYDLRAADALQLAAALEWCEGAPRGRIFLSADDRLRDAALLAGFEAKGIHENSD